MSMPTDHMCNVCEKNGTFIRSYCEGCDREEDDCTCKENEGKL